MTTIHHRGLLLLFFFFFLTSGEPPSAEIDALHDFLSRTLHSPRIRWDRNTPACSWTGIRCNKSNKTFIALHLPATSLLGKLSFPGISSLRVLSLHHNGLSGPLPDLSNLTSLRSLYLHKNTFSGPFPDWVPKLQSLFRLDLSFNSLDGTIPPSLNNVHTLNLLHLQGNNFSGELPSLNIPALKHFNVSNNQFNGSIPATLSHFPSSAFVGNLELCGKPLDACPSSATPEEDDGGGKKLKPGAIVGIALAATVGLLL